MPATQPAALRLAIFLMGFTSIAWQILIIREFLVVFQGIELTLGIIFANWLLLEAAGCAFARRRAETTKSSILILASLQAGLGVFAVLGILLLRSIRYLSGIPMGELLGYHHVFLISISVLAPFTLLKGAMFPFACSSLNVPTSSESPANRVYVMEAVGAFMAGIVFVAFYSFHFDHLSFSTILLCLNLTSAFLCLRSFAPRFPARTAVIALLALLLLFFAFSMPTKWHERSSALLWHQGTLVETKNSEYSNITALESDGQFTFFLNGVPFASVPDPPPFLEEQAHFPLLFHPEPRRVLVIGGGAGGLIAEILKHSVDKLFYTEPDPLLIDFLRRHPTTLTDRELSHPAVRIHFIEGIRFLLTAEHKFDVVIVNLPPPSTLQVNRYFTKEFFELVQTRLKLDGILSLSLPGSETFLGDELLELNRLIFRTLDEVFSDIRVIIGERNVFLSSDATFLNSIEPVELIHRFRERNLRTNLVDEFYVQYKMDPLRFGPLQDSIKEDNDSEINTITLPRGVFRNTVLNSLVVTPSLVWILHLLDAIPTFVYLSGILILSVFLVILQTWRKGLVHVSHSIITTGFAGMLMYILLVLYFQVHYGYVYHYIGLLTALFMGGTAVGAFVAARRTGLSLLRVEIGIVTVIALFLLGSVSGAFSTATTGAAIVLSMLVMGTLTGMAYPVAVRMVSRTRRTVALQPARLYALDLVGALFGAILTAIVLVPSLGIHATLLLVLCLKASSAALVGGLGGSPAKS